MPKGKLQDLRRDLITMDINRCRALTSSRIDHLTDNLDRRYSVTSRAETDVPNNERIGALPFPHPFRKTLLANMELESFGTGVRSDMHRLSVRLGADATPPPFEGDKFEGYIGAHERSLAVKENITHGI
jgi:hypothetical protein